MKVEEQISFLSQNEVEVAIGTPNRMLKIIEQQGVENNLIGSARCVIVDASYKDQKQRTLFDIPECRKDFFTFLKNSGCLEGIRSGVIKLYMF